MPWVVQQKTLLLLTATESGAFKIQLLSNKTFFEKFKMYKILEKDIHKYKKELELL